VAALLTCLSPDEKIVGRLAFYKHSCLMQDVSDPCGPLFPVKEGDMESLNASNRSRTLSIALGILVSRSSRLSLPHF